MTLEMGSFEGVVGEINNRFRTNDNNQDNWQIAQNIIHDLGGNAVNFARTSSTGDQISWGRSSMTDAWLKQYEIKKYHLVDPLLSALIDGLPEVMTDSGISKPSDPAYDLNHDLKAHGYGSVFATTTGSMTSGYRSMVVFCSEEPLAQVDANIGFNLLRIIHAILAANVLIKPNMGESGFVDLRPKSFTQKETDTLCWLARGLRNDQIAYKLNVAEVTVRKHLLAVREKLGASTREEAIATALRDEWITL